MPTTAINIKRPNENKETLNGSSPPSKIRRIHPLKIGEVRGSTSFRNDSDDEDNKNENKLDLSSQSSSQNLSTVSSKNDENTESQLDQSQEGPTTSTNQEKVQNEETEELKRFIKACRKAESNDDMKKIIKKKLLKNYHLVSATFALSNNFKKLLKDTTNDILRDPKRVYSKIQDIVNELEARKLRKNKNEVVVPAVIEVSSSQPSQESSEENGLHLETTGDKKKDGHLKKLNRALVSLKHQIEDLEEAEVNLDDDDNSAYLQKVRFEKRAIEIYNKICSLTGESTHAHRIVKKPIRFKDSKYKEFNKGLTRKINKENGFPTYFDVYRLLDFCNKEHKYQLAKYQIEEVARASFTSVGELLKERRRDDLYESASYWTRESKDPAKEDAELKAKLDVNREINRKKTDEIIEFFVKKQYEEITDQQQPGTSKSFEIKDEDENDDHVNLEDICPTLSPPVTEEDMISLIDVKAEQISEDFEKSSNDDSNASLVKFAILS